MGHLSDDALLLAASSAVREDTPFAFSIGKKPPKVYADFLGRARNYTNAEASTSKKSGSSKASRGNPDGDRRKEMKRPVEAPVGGNRQYRDEKRLRNSTSGPEESELAGRGTTGTKSSRTPSGRSLSAHGVRLTSGPLHP